MATLQEAIESGRPFKRKDFNLWYRYYPESFCMKAENCYSTILSISIGEAISTDWEIKPVEPRKWEYEARTSNHEGDRYVYSPFDYPANIKVKVTIEEIIE